MKVIIFIWAIGSVSMLCLVIGYNWPYFKTWKKEGKRPKELNDKFWKTLLMASMLSWVSVIVIVTYLIISIIKDSINGNDGEGLV